MGSVLKVISDVNFATRPTSILSQIAFSLIVIANYIDKAINIKRIEKRMINIII